MSTMIDRLKELCNSIPLQGIPVSIYESRVQQLAAEGNKVRDVWIEVEPESDAEGAHICHVNALDVEQTMSTDDGFYVALDGEWFQVVGTSQENPEPGRTQAVLDAKEKLGFA